MIGKLLGKEEVNATLVLALSGAVMVVVANGPGLMSLGRIASGVLSHPVPGGAASTRRSSSYVPAPLRQQQVAA
jgi:hypothetical protein